MVTIQYNPAPSVPDHLREVFRMKGQSFAAGEKVVTTPERAAAVIASAPAGSIKVISGEASAPPARLPASLKRSQDAVIERARLFPTDPARALHGLPQLPDKAASTLLGRNGVKSIRSGDHDDRLAVVGIFCWLAGPAGADAAEAAAQRAATLLADAQG